MGPADDVHYTEEFAQSKGSLAKDLREASEAKGGRNGANSAMNTQPNEQPPSALSKKSTSEISAGKKSAGVRSGVASRTQQSVGGKGSQHDVLSQNQVAK